jgi:pentapeptide MXKDX repeat protein
VKGVKSLKVDTEMLVGEETEDNRGAGVEGCSDGADELDSANVEGVTSDVDDKTLSVTDGMEVDSYDGGKDLVCHVGVGVTVPGDSSVGVNGVEGGEEEGKDGGSGGKATVEREEIERSADKTEGDTDGGKGGKSRISEKIEGDLIEGDLMGDLVGDLIEGDLMEGDLMEGALMEGDLMEGDLMEGDLMEGDLMEGALMEGALIEGDLMEGTTDGGADGREGKLRTLLSSSESNLIDERVGVYSEGISASSDGAISAVIYSDPAEGSEIVR